MHYFVLFPYKDRKIKNLRHDSRQSKLQTSFLVNKAKNREQILLFHQNIQGLFCKLDRLEFCLNEFRDNNKNINIDVCQ